MSYPTIRRDQVDGMDYEEILAEMDVGGIDKNVLTPLDLTTTAGGWLATNEQIAGIVADQPDRFIGFASVDPNREDAPNVLERAFTELGARGVALHPAKQRFWATDACMGETSSSANSTR